MVDACQRLFVNVVTVRSRLSTFESKEDAVCLTSFNVLAQNFF